MSALSWSSFLLLSVFQSLLSNDSCRTEASFKCAALEGKWFDFLFVGLLTSPGWLPDTLLSQFEDEIRRVSASKPLWESTLKRMSSDVLLMLPLTPHLFLRLGNDHSVPHSEVASA
jgi:hypothetical protein